MLCNFSVFLCLSQPVLVYFTVCDNKRGSPCFFAATRCIKVAWISLPSQFFFYRNTILSSCSWMEGTEMCLLGRCTKSSHHNASFSLSGDVAIVRVKLLLSMWKYKTVQSAQTHHIMTFMMWAMWWGERRGCYSCYKSQVMIVDAPIASYRAQTSQ